MNLDGENVHETYVRARMSAILNGKPLPPACTCYECKPLHRIYKNEGDLEFSGAHILCPCGECVEEPFRKIIGWGDDE